MADHLLDAVIRLENSIQQQLLLEQQRADAWLNGVRAEQGAALQCLEQQLTVESDRVMSAARQQIETEADALVAHEIAYCARLEEISDQVLLEVLRRQLVPRLIKTSG